MKHFRILLFTILLTLFATVAMGQTYDTPTSASEGSTYVLYSGEVDMTAGAEDSYYTQALYIGDSNQSIGGLMVEVGDSTGTEDINIFVEYSQDLLTWNPISTAAKDLQGAGTDFYTINDIGGSTLDEFTSAVYVRLHFDGQTGNPALVVDWSLYLPKNTGAPLRGIAAARDRRTS